MRPVAAPAAPAAAESGHEELVVRRGRRSGVEMIIAIDSTALGPALGGVRLWEYPTLHDAVEDATRLSRGMTLKAAAAGLELGGGKGVIRSPGPSAALDRHQRRALMLDFAELVESLDGCYVTAEDVGTGPRDMAEIATLTEHVTGRPPEQGGAGDPSPFTAAGVQAAVRACMAHEHGSADLRGAHVVVVGLGHVGERLAAGLAAGGAELTATDIDPAKRRVAEALGARWVEPEGALEVPCDVLAPCALGGAINLVSVSRLRARIVCGAANNQLAEDALADRLQARGILYAPDFIANAGGLINVYRELRGLEESWARERVDGIELTMGTILATAREREITPLGAATAIAGERLADALRD